MNIGEILELHTLIIENSEKVLARRKGLSLRKAAINSMFNNVIVKIAFDTRRINQEADYNPRRGLQNYNRSQQFITEAHTIRITNFTKLKNILDEVKLKYDREPEWQDSYSRVLSNTLNIALRVKQNDGDFSDTQTAIGSFDYVDDLLFTRYRLDINTIAKYGEEQLRDIILSRDENLIRKTDSPKYEITKRDVASQPYDVLLDKLFNGVRASSENKNVERTVTITIRDTFLEGKENE